MTARKTAKVPASEAGLHAVARVRDVKEQDSRLGLQHAMAEQAAREQHLAELRGRLAAAPGLETSVLSAGASPAAYLSLRTALGHLGEAERAAALHAATGERLTAVARERWTADKTRLAAVEMLLERRAEERRVEADRRAAHEQDDIAGQGWLRRRAAAAARLADDGSAR